MADVMIEAGRGSIPANVPSDRIIDFDMFNPIGIENGFHEAWKQLQKPGTPSLVWTPHNGGHWIATRGEMIRDFFRDPELFSSQVIILPREAGEKYDFIPTRMDPPRHAKFRDVVNKSLNLREVRKMEAAVRNTCIELIGPLFDRGRCNFSTEFAQVFPIRVFMKMADLPMEDATYLAYLAAQIVRPDGSTPSELAASLDKANKQFFEYLDPVIDARTGKDGQDIISVSVNSTIDDEPMAKADALSLISNLLLAGLDTVASFLSFMMLFLARNENHLRQLADDRALIPTSVEELFRRFPVVSDGRVVTRDVEFDGVQLKQNEMVLIATVLPGIDDQLNEDPMSVNFRRKRPQHTTFGEGPHRCAGMHLARMEVTIMLEEWLSRIPNFRLANDAKLTFHSGTIGAVENVLLEWPIA